MSSKMLRKQNKLTHLFIIHVAFVYMLDYSHSSSMPEGMHAQFYKDEAIMNQWVALDDVETARHLYEDLLKMPISLSDKFKTKQEAVTAGYHFLADFNEQVLVKYIESQYSESSARYMEGIDIEIKNVKADLIESSSIGGGHSPYVDDDAVSLRANENDDSRTDPGGAKTTGDNERGKTGNGAPARNRTNNKDKSRTNAADNNAEVKKDAMKKMQSEKREIKVNKKRNLFDDAVGKFAGYMK